MKVGSLFSGIGGLDLGLERAGMEVVWQSEIDPLACRVLANHWPDVPNLGDITLIDWKDVPRVDLIRGGFPCQDISSAGEKAGIGGARSGLWSIYADAVRALRPRYVLVENVADLLARGMGRVVGDLAEVGYDVEWNCVRAADVGAPIGGRGRDRLFLLAQPHSVGLEESRLSRLPLGELVAGAPGSGRDVTWLPRAASNRWPAEPDVGRVADGVPSRVDRLRALGNAVVPDVVEDHDGTLELWHEWAPLVRDLGHRPAFALQNGCTPSTVPGDADALFIGGDTEWKIGPTAKAICQEYGSRCWLHMGRVNTWNRIQRAAHFGCDSVDGTYLKWPDANLPKLMSRMRRINAPQLFERYCGVLGERSEVR